MSLLSKELPSVIINAFITEYNMLIPERQDDINRWLAEFKLIGISNFFTTDAQSILVKQMAENQFLRTFLLNHSERVWTSIFFLEHSNPRWVDELIDYVAHYRANLTKNSILPLVVTESLHMDMETISLLLHTNLWVLDLYLMLTTDGVFDYMDSFQEKTN